MRPPRVILPALVLALVLALAACGETAAEPETPDLAGRYVCQSLTVRDLELDPEGRWLRLDDDGTGVLCLTGARETGTWSLEGDAFVWGSEKAGGHLASGTWEDGVLTLDVGEMTGVFLREEAAATPTPLPDGDEADPLPTEGPAAPAARETLSCYDGLFFTEYDPRVLSPAQDGADLAGTDGTRIWLARLSSRELTDDWLLGLAEKGLTEEYAHFETHAQTAAGCPAQTVVYQDETGWHAEGVVALGEDRGAGDLPLWGICLTASGPSREAVWTNGLAPLLSSLRLEETG